MSLPSARRHRVLCVVVVLSVSVINSPSAYSADCQLEAESISGYSLRTTAPGVFPGSTPAPVQPGASNASDNRALVYAQVFADCMRRQAAAQSPGASQPSASPSETREKQR